MVIVRLSTGLANQIFEYAAAYAVSKELSTELVLDISECLKSPKGFLLDYFNLPNAIKFYYEPIDAECLGHAAIHGVPDNVLNGKVILTDLEINSEKYTVIRYKHLRQIHEIGMNVSIYMCGYFMNKQYFGKWWREVQQCLTLRKNSVEVNAFQKEIINKNTVGIHIRRGDFLYEDWPEKMPDNYYKAAVVLLEVILKCPYFYVFSDDIEYAKKILGNKKNLKYIHFTGYQDADLYEFICLSLCKHKIISNSSTFSRLADELGNHSDRILVKKSNECVHWENKIIELSDKAINSLAKIYFCSNKNKYSKEFFRSQKEVITNSDLSKIANLTINSYNVSPKKWLKLSLLKMEKLSDIFDWTAVLQTAFPIYYKYRGNKKYDLLLINALIHIGAYEEALVEGIRSGMKCGIPELGDLYHKLYKMKLGKYIIVPLCKSNATSFPTELVEMGIILSHLGNEVLYVFEPVNLSEEKYIENNEYFINHKGIFMGGRQISYQKVSVMGLDRLLLKEKREGVNNYIISRRPEFLFHAKRCGYIGLFYDYSYVHDAERKYANEDMVKECIDNADYVISHNIRMKENCSNSIYVEMPKEEKIAIVDERWDLCNENRLSKRYIRVVSEMGEVL